jgi:hypothetical protein
MIDSAGLTERIFAIIAQLHELRRPMVVPTKAALTKVLEDVFWASVQQYEGNPLRPRIYFAPKEALVRSDSIVQLLSRHQLSVRAIRNFGPAHALDGALLVIEDADGVWIEGILGGLPFVRTASPHWLGIECRGPAHLRISSGFEPILEFTRGAVKQLGGMSFDRTAAEVLLMGAGLLPCSPAGLEWHVASAVLDIGHAIEQYGTGGAIWILPAGISIDERLEKSGQRVEMRSGWWEPYREMWEMRTSAIRQLNPGCDKGHEFLQDAAQQWDLLRQEALTRTVSSFAKIDGAIVINGTPDVLAFGVICNDFPYPATQLQRPSDDELLHTSAFGGSRHRSAIDFCSSYSPAGAVVASHDGGLTVFVSMSKGQVIGSSVSLIGRDADVRDT